jgi:hypothetical protein
VRSLKPYLLLAGGTCMALALFAAMTLLPIPPWMGATLRYGFGFWVLGLCMLLFLAYRSPKIWPAAVLLLLLFALSLSGLWRNASNELQVLSGFLFFSDAAQYQADAMRLLAGFPISAFSARHPLSTLFLGTLLWLGDGNLQLALLFLGFIMSLCIYVAADALARVAGPLAAAVLATSLFLFCRRFTGIPNTEQLGLAFGCLSLVFLFRAAEGHARSGLLGLVLLGLALVTRPGTFMILLVCLIWVTRRSPLFPEKPFVGLCARALAISLGLTLTLLCNSLLAEKGSIPFSNYSYSLYGIAAGNRGWEQFLSDYPDARVLPAGRLETFAFREAFLAFEANPLSGLQSWAQSFLEYFTIGARSLFGFISGGESSSLGLPEPAALQPVYFLIRLLLYAGTILGMWTLWQKRHQPVFSLLFWAGVAILLGLIFIPARDAGMMRVHAASLPYLLCLPSLSFASLFQKRYVTMAGGNPHQLPGILAGCLLLVLTASLPLFVLFPQNMDLSDDTPTCALHETLVTVGVKQGSYLKVTDTAASAYDFASVSYSDFLNRVHGFYRADLLAGLAHIPPEALLMTYVDLRTGQSGWLIIPRAGDVFPTGTVNVCGKWHSGLLAKGLGFLQADQVNLISSK